MILWRKRYVHKGDLIESMQNNFKIIKSKEINHQDNCSTHNKKDCKIHWGQTYREKVIHIWADSNMTSVIPEAGVKMGFWSAWIPGDYNKQSPLLTPEYM